MRIGDSWVNILFMLMLYLAVVLLDRYPSINPSVGLSLTLELLQSSFLRFCFAVTSFEAVILLVVLLQLELN